MSGVFTQSSSLPSANGLTFAGWNQDHGCFASGMESGFRIYNADPLKEKERQDFDDGGLGYVEMLFRCNYLALVGGGPKPKFPPNHVIVWDDLKKKSVVDLTFESEVKAVKLRRDSPLRSVCVEDGSGENRQVLVTAATMSAAPTRAIVVVLQSNIRVFNFTQSPRELRRIDTGLNPKGLCALCPNSNNSLMVYPSRGIGRVELLDLGTQESEAKEIAAHETAITCIALNLQGTRAATASEKGTLIRVYDTTSLELLTELRRGTVPAGIYCVNFNADSSLLCAASDHATVHVFALDDVQRSGGKGLFSMSKNPKKSFQRFAVSPNSQCICAFGSDKNCVVAICADGNYYKFTYDTASDRKETICKKFLQMTDD